MSRRRKTADQLGGSHEVYPTPEWCVHRLLDEVELPVGIWLEPACGDGAIVRAAEAHSERYRGVRWWLCDVREDALNAAVEAASLLTYQEWCGDFTSVAEDRVRHLRGVASVAITNPPFSLAQDFIVQTRRMVPLVYMLLPLPFFGSAGREAFFREHAPTAIYQLPDRPVFAGTGSNSVEYGWWCWNDHAPKIGFTLLKRLGTTPKGVRRPATPRATDSADGRGAA